MRGLNLVGPSQSRHQAVQARGEAVDIEIQRIVVAVGDLCVDRGMELSAFDLLRSWRHDHPAVLCAFDLIQLKHSHGELAMPSP